MIGERTCHFRTRTGDIPGSNAKTLLITEHTRTAILLGGLTGRTWTQDSTLALMTDMSVTARHVCAHTYLRYGNFLTLEVNAFERIWSQRIAVRPYTRYQRNMQSQRMVHVRSLRLWVGRH